MFAHKTGYKSVAFAYNAGLEYMYFIVFDKYEGRSICNENSPVYPKVLHLHTLWLFSLKCMFLGYINVKFQMSTSLSYLHKPLSR